jgi:hypothetical protein
MHPTFTACLDHIYTLAQAKVHPDLLERLEHAYKLASTDQVHPQGPDRWTVHGSQPAPYVVTHGATWQCSCQDAAYHPHQSCKHIFAAQLWTRAQQALAAAQMVAEDADAREATAQVSGVEENLATLATLPPAVLLPLPEARASVNVRLTICGHDTQVTLRDHDEAALLMRLEALLQKYPAPAATAASQGEAGKQCPVHHVRMKFRPGKNGTPGWWSHRLADDAGWCRGT